MSLWIRLEYLVNRPTCCWFCLPMTREDRVDLVFFNDFFCRSCLLGRTGSVGHVIRDHYAVTIASRIIKSITRVEHFLAVDEISTTHMRHEQSTQCTIGRKVKPKESNMVLTVLLTIFYFFSFREWPRLAHKKT